MSLSRMTTLRRPGEEMIGVDKIEDIRKRGRRGESVASISRQTGVSEPTVRKYLRAPDLSPEPPRRREPESELLELYRASIDAWLDDDCRCLCFVKRN